MRRLAAILPLLFLLPGCTDDSVTEPASGSIRVIVATTGDVAGTGYTVNVDGTIDRSVSANGNVTIGTLSPGVHEVQLNAVPTNCTVSGANPRSSEVVVGETVEVTFDVSCVSGKPDDPEDPDDPAPVPLV